MISPSKVTSGDVWDRTHHVPLHRGPNVLPNTPMLSQILHHALKPGRLAITDLNSGVEKTYAHLLADVLYLRNYIEASLPSATRRKLDNEEDVFIGVLAAGGYEYVVAFLAVMALRGTIVPMSIALPVEEALYFVQASKQVLILHSAAAKSLGTALVELANQRSGSAIGSIEIGEHLSKASIRPLDIILSSDGYLDDNAAGLVIFTSGTTGRPKGAVWSRGVVREAAKSFMEQYEIKSSDVVLHVLPVHHATGITITLTPFLMAGACVEFRSGSFDAEWMWNRWRTGGLTHFSGVPTIYMRLMRFFVQHIQSLPEDKIAEYVQGANQISSMFCGTSGLPTPVQEFWTSLRNGKPMLARYGGTEFGSVLTVPLGDQVPVGSVGKPMPGMDIKLSNGDEGEILVKSPVMFSKYLFDLEATKSCHDEQGYFKTGDIGRKEGDNYFIMGRASVDIIKSGGYKISALDIERECLGLPYVEEVMCIGIEDEEYGQRVAVAVKVREDQSIYASHSSRHGKHLSIHDLRKDLRSRLAGYKLPTMLRILDEELPKTASGKVQKKKLGPELFPSPGWHKNPAIQVWRNSQVEVLAKL